MMTVCNKDKDTAIYLTENDCIKIISSKKSNKFLIIQCIKGNLFVKKVKNERSIK